DYNFLEEVGRRVDNASRENTKLESELNPNRKRNFGANNNSNNKKARNQNNNKSGEEATGVVELSLTVAQELERQVPENSGTYRDKQLIMQARRRGTQLIRMADGLKKRKENNTHWRDKPSRILWTIEWLFPEMNATGRLLEHKNDDLTTLKDLLSTALTKPDNGDVAKRYPGDVLEKCHFYFVIPLRHANQPALYPLKGTDSLQDALKFKKVLEYPTILVVGPSSPSTSASIQSSSTPAAADVVLEAESGETGKSSAPADPTTSASNDTSPVSVADHSHLALKKYIIEEPPTQWPKRAAAAVSASATESRQQNNNKRSNDTHGESEDASKKAKLKEGDDDEEEESSDDSSDDSSSDSDDSDDSSSDDSDDSADDEDKVEPEAPAADTEAKEAADLAIGQAVMDAFNQDFGQSE
ncbi:hypothetical protein EDD21DRAFT_389581, partial [Dissophora ornata]